MIGALFLLAALAAPGAAPAPPPRPMRVMSINLCSDQLAMLLLPPQRIASLTYLSRRASVTPALEAQAGATAVNHGLAEEVLAQKPDLIVGSRYTSPATRRVARLLGIPLVELDPANGFDDVRAQLRQLGQAFGDSRRAEAWIARMDAGLAELARTAPARPITAVGWDAAGRVPGERSLFDAVLRAAGGRNLAARPGAQERSLDLESLLRLQPRPQLLLYGTSRRITAGERANLQAHPALVRAFKSRRLAYPQNATACGTPYAVDAAAQLRRDMLAALAGTGGRR